MQCLPFPVVTFIRSTLDCVYLFVFAIWQVALICNRFPERNLDEEKGAMPQGLARERPVPRDDAAMALLVKGSERLDGYGGWEGKTMAEGSAKLAEAVARGGQRNEVRAAASPTVEAGFLTDIGRRRREEGDGWRKKKEHQPFNLHRTAQKSTDTKEIACNLHIANPLLLKFCSGSSH